MTNIPAVNKVEQLVHIFWRASLSYKARPGGRPKYSMAKLFQELGPLYNVNTPLMAVARQAEDLASLAVEGMRYRKEQMEGKVLPFNRQEHVVCPEEMEGTRDRVLKTTTMDIWPNCSSAR